MEIEDHYSQLLGIRVPWKISKVDLDMWKAYGNSVEEKLPQKISRAWAIKDLVRQT